MGEEFALRITIAKKFIKYHLDKVKMHFLVLENYNIRKSLTMHKIIAFFWLAVTGRLIICLVPAFQQLLS